MPYAIIISFLCFILGELSEWFKERAWKVRIPQKGIEGSNPSFSALKRIAIDRQYVMCFFIYKISEIMDKIAKLQSYVAECT